MLPRNDPDRIEIAFDDHRLEANAGLILPVTLPHRLALVLQPHMIGRALEASLAMGMPGPGLMPSSPSRPPYRKVITLGTLPQQSA